MKLAVLLGFTFLTSLSYSQLELIGTSGSSTMGAGMGVSWSLGEVVTFTISNTSNTVPQGFQQAEINVLSINNEVSNEISLNLYPNPAIDLVNISSSDQMILTVFSLEGKVIERKEILYNENQMDISMYPAGTYFFNFSTFEGIAFKIIKVIKN